MKIAVTYENGNIFQHFGRTEYFKVYEVEDGKILSSEVISSNGIGHGALAGLLADRDIRTLICGGLGGGALNALTNAGIEVCAGASGDAGDIGDGMDRDTMFADIIAQVDAKYQSALDLWEQGDKAGAETALVALAGWSDADAKLEALREEIADDAAAAEDAAAAGRS